VTDDAKATVALVVGLILFFGALDVIGWLLRSGVGS
jgi:hypothetical protein